MSAITITKENFEQEVLRSDKPVLLDFWASWCGPCQMLSPIVKQIAEEHKEIKVGSINVDEQPDLASTFRVDSIPALFVMKDGKAVASAVGYRPKKDVEMLLAQA